MKKIVILGAGISGLAIGWFLKKKYQNSIELTIIEKSHRVGGWICSIKEHDFLFETGPRGFRPTGKGKATLALVKELALEKELKSSDNQASKRYIWLEGKLRYLSIGFLIRQGILSALWHDMWRSASKLEDETIADFISRRFNKRIAENLMDPLAKGIFGGDYQKLSMRSCLPLLWNFEKEKGSVIRGFFGVKREKSNFAALYTFKDGMETLPRMLSKKLEGNIHFSKNINSLSEVDADIIISCIPSFNLAEILKIQNPIKYETLSTVNFGWNDDILKKTGYGFLVPSKEKGEILGMTWDSQIFPDKGQTRICVMLNGEDKVFSRASQSLKNYLKISKPACAHFISVARKSIPQYTLNHHLRIKAFKKAFPPNLYALGNYFEGIGINDCIFNAKLLAETLKL